MSGWRDLRTGTIAGVAAVVAAAVCVTALAPVFAPPAQAQSGWWPFGGNDDRPPPRRLEPGESPYRTPVPPPPPGNWGQQRREAGPPPAQGNICFQLEQRLVAEGQRGNQPRDVLPKIEADMRLLDRDIRSTQIQLDREDCYETWLFSRTLKRSRQCVDLAQRSEDLRRRMSDLDIQRQQIMGQGTGRSMQDEIIRELARNNCGPNYQQEARRRGGSGNPFGSFFWQDEEAEVRPQQPTNQFGALPYATYRTLCVRTCDGYYFPISFATLPSHFPQDVDACRSRCAAPTELYYHQNPGGAVEEMVAVSDNKPYTSMKNAFRHRKEYVEGCSCKQAEYVPSAGEPTERKAQAPEAARPASASQRR